MKPPQPQPLHILVVISVWIWITTQSSSVLFAADTSSARWRLEFLSDLNIPTGTPYESADSTTTQSNEQTTPAQDRSRDAVLSRKASGVFGGISAIAFDSETSTLYALSDSSTPTMFPFKLHLNKHEMRLESKSVIRFVNAEGEPLPRSTVDPEGIALTPSGTFYISSEGYVARTPPVPPAIMEFSARGHLMRQFNIPQKYLPTDTANSARGVRVNKGLETLTLSPNATHLYTASEHPLKQDPTGCGLNEPCIVRVLKYSMREDEPQATHEYLYELDPLTSPAGFAATTGTLGLPDLLSLGNNELLAIERGFMRGRERNGQNRIRIFHLTINGATDILHTDKHPSKENVQSLHKTLVADLDDVVDQLDPGFRRLDNFEGICFGPTLENGSQSVILVSDNNFSRQQRTAFLLFRLMQR